MKKIIAIAFTYSSLYFMVYATRSIYLMSTYQPGSNRFMSTAITAEAVLVFYCLPIAFAVCLVLAHRSLLKQTPVHSFKNILVLSVLFLFITWGITYAAAYAEYGLFYKNQYTEQQQNGLEGLVNAFNNPRPQPPQFAPLTQLFWAPVQTAYDLLTLGRYWGALHVLLISNTGIVLTVLYFEALYMLFKKYRHKKWFYILPVINKWKLVQIAQKPAWYFFVLFIPVVRIIVLYSIHLKIAAHFKKNKLFALGMTLLAPFYYGAVAFNNEQPGETPEN